MQLYRIARVLVVAGALGLLGACDRPESSGDSDDSSLREEEPWVPRLPSEFTNLEVLPSDITKAALKRHMKGITKSLGIKCDYCHRTDIRDYATDEIAEKVVAREMMRMVERINHEEFTWEGAPEATCFMCHHGEPKPQLDPVGPGRAGGDEDL